MKPICKCENCNFWEPINGGAQIGECRANPPTAHVVLIPAQYEPVNVSGKIVNAGSNPQMAVQFTQPQTPPGYWCGAFLTEKSIN